LKFNWYELDPDPRLKGELAKQIFKEKPVDFENKILNLQK